MVGIDAKWDNFLCASAWGAVSFNTTGYWSLCDFLQKHGLCGRKGIVNGDAAYIVTPIPAEELPTCPTCPATCVTTESQIPQPIAILSSVGDSFKVMECFDDKNDLYEVCEALNNSRYVKGNNWTVCEGKLLCPIGNKIYIL